ncbi:Gfo/Idh/MocA family protein [Paenibacillus septentrionalis]|uniref:Gfo/Idh/MocA family protein n=1 Tax=Paenibacillus septentrionalis TaxID=429342 RepID=A0ABW1V543_9BACL
MQKVKVGIIGCGNISDAYLKNCVHYEQLEVVALADLNLELAKSKASTYGIERVLTTDELLADPEIEIVLNLTIPQAHAEISLSALEAGKHVYSEKPLAVTVEDGKRIIEKAKERKLRVGVAPDTVLGSGIQTCRKLIDEGVIGKPIAAAAFMLSGGPESWHPNPAFLYAKGAGPMFDMGPYYLSAFITLLGPIKRVTGSAVISYPEREITSQPLNGQMIEVETPTHINSVIDFESGATATLTTSFDIKGGSTLPNIELYGSEGSLIVPDPNTFSGPVKLRKAGSDQFEEIALTHPYDGPDRGVGLLEMAQAIRENRPHRASGELALQVLEIMHGVHIASAEGRHYEVQHTCERPEAMPEKK